MSWTNTPLTYDSWSTPTLVFDPHNHGEETFTDDYCVDGSPSDELATSIDANFNGVINADGSFVGLWRTWECASDLCPENGYATLGATTNQEHATQ